MDRGLLDNLKDVLQDRISFSESVRNNYAKGEDAYDPILPKAVLFPENNGELSRILLALRTILSNSDSISIFFFDEIDAGIGGETALFIGKALLKVAHHSQVIAITHFQQIANFANKLIHVSKISEKDPSSSVRTISHIQEITGKGKVEYIQAMNPLH